MKIFVERASDRKSKEEVRSLECDVFERELKLTLPTFEADTDSFQLIARTGPGEPAVGIVTVVDTTSDLEMNRRYGHRIEAGKRSARYTRLAVRREFRGLGIPLFLVYEANRRFVQPDGFHFSWLLFAHDRARTASLSTLFNLRPLNKEVLSEYGKCQVLQRDETSARARAGNIRTARFLAASTRVQFHPRPQPGSTTAFETEYLRALALA